ncbi:Xaa-Pro dipeptidyl-peptidase [Pendulispora albinea]|uniref:Xaa-Pro dipeptidyl-peptidase n=1 Tax=Pendulispora albinea TaxID=2741071 RepID=A0ABZ2M7E5_9BACT
MAHLRIRSSIRRVLRIAAVTGTGFLYACSSATETGSSDTSGSPLGVAANGNESTPIYSYANAIHESIWVTTPFDNDGDGQPDKVAVDLIRPREAAEAGVKVPVILEASPYYKGSGRGNESERKAFDANGIITKVPLYYDNYFVPRGYAFVAVDLPGSSRSTGCLDAGGKEEVLGTKAVIDWLNGRATAARADGTPVLADWTTGKVGMIGKSWDGSIANGVAATGVDGLVTIVPQSAISSWYEYTRANGTLRGADYFGFLAAGRNNGRPPGVCDANVAELRKGQDDATGNYNAFFAERDYVPDVSKVKASVFLTHGIDDWIVTTPQFGTWWNALAARGVPRKIWLSQGAHVDPFDIRRAEWVSTLHRWFDYWLQGRDNGIMNEPMASIERTPGNWVNEPTWPTPAARESQLQLAWGKGDTGRLDFVQSKAADSTDPVIDTVVFTDDKALTEADAVSDPSTRKNGRLVFLSRALSRDIRISGRPRVKLTVKVDKPTTEITARLVDYGSATRNINYLAGKGGLVNLTTESCWGESTALDDACYIDMAQDLKKTDLGVLTRGWVDAAHRNSLTSPSPLDPSKWYDITVPLDSEDSVIPAGHVVGLVIAASDFEMTEPQSTGATLSVDLVTSRLYLPIANADESALATATAPHITARAPSPSSDWRRDSRDFAIAPSSGSGRDSRDFAIAPSSDGRPGSRDFAIAPSSGSGPDSRDFAIAPSSDGRPGSRDFAIAPSSDGRPGSRDFAIAPSSGSGPGSRDFAIAPSSGSGPGSRDFAIAPSSDGRPGSRDFAIAPSSDGRRDSRDFAMSSFR